VYGQVTTSTNAIIGLILSILSWTVCPIVPAVIALVLASKSDQEIEASGGRVDGAGLNTATPIIAWLNVGILGAVIALGLVVTLFVLVAAVASGSGL